jgi:hypothetical protein
MATALNFTSLVATLQSYLERGTSVTDPTVYAQLPSLINLAERAIARRLKITGMICPVTSVLQAGVPVYQKPSGWRRTTSMNYGVSTASDPAPAQNSRTPIFARSYEYCRAYWPDATAQDPPQYYCDYDYQHWLIVPTPDISYPWEINYYGLPNLLDATNQTNFWTNFAPETLLYRALLECTPFLKNDERIETWKAMYEEAVTNLNTEDLTRVVDRASVRKED